MHLLTNNHRFEDGLDVERLLARAGAFDEPAWDGGYRFYFRRRRAWMRLAAKLKKERVWIKGWHLPASRRRKLPWLEEYRVLVAVLDREPQRIHRRIYRDALKRAKQPETKGTCE